MNFTPVINFDKSKYPIWEINNINIPDELYKSVQNGGWSPYSPEGSKYNPQPKTRFILENYDYSITKDLSIQINDFISKQKDYDLQLVDNYHPDIIPRRIRSLTWRIEPVKDILGYKLGVHLDYKVGIGTAIINLRDNKTVTEYFADEKGEKLIYKGTGKKGTGVIHLNTPYTYHRVRNTSGENRYILHCVLSNPTL